MIYCWEAAPSFHAVAPLAIDLALSRSIRRPLPPRQFSKCMCSNEIHRLGRGIQTHNRHFNRHLCPGYLLSNGRVTPSAAVSPDSCVSVFRRDKRSRASRSCRGVINLVRSLSRRVLRFSPDREKHRGFFEYRYPDRAPSWPSLRCGNLGNSSLRPRKPQISLRVCVFRAGRPRPAERQNLPKEPAIGMHITRQKYHFMIPLNCESAIHLTPGLCRPASAVWSLYL